MKTITICNSGKLYQQVLQLKKDLENLGYKVLVHEAEVNVNGNIVPVEKFNEMKKTKWNSDVNKAVSPKIRAHFDKIEKSDAIVVMNKDKDDKKNYIGGNTLIEMGLAFYLKLPIFLTNPVPEYLSYAEEIKGVNPIILKKLEDIKKHL